MSKLPARTARQVRTRARGQCEYCQSQEELVGEEFTVDHVIPRSSKGDDELDNLCLACFACNHRKQSQTSAMDPSTDRLARLFHPRHDPWSDHFIWSSDGTRILGITSIGRATVVALKLNSRNQVRARKFWVKHGVHPPKD